MSAGEVFLLVVRWFHLIAAAAWIGGSLFYLLVLRPASRKAPNSSRALNVAVEFRGLVDTSIIVLVATGVVLTFDRLNEGIVGAPYVVTLGIKIALSAWMFQLARARLRTATVGDSDGEGSPTTLTRTRRIVRLVTRYNTLIILGIVVFLMSDLLKVLFELALERN